MKKISLTSYVVDYVDGREMKQESSEMRHIWLEKLIHKQQKHSWWINEPVLE